MTGPSAGITNFQNLVEGRWVDSGSPRYISVINPTTERELWKVTEGDPCDVDVAVASARRLFESGHWSDAPPSLRKRVLHQLADRIEVEAESIDALDAEEMGKPKSEPFGNARTAAGVFRFCAEAIDKLSGEVCLTDRASLVIRRLTPRGVVGAITAWNFPAYVAALKLGPALAAGNSVVLKPSELASRSSLRIAELALEAGLPPGVLNVVCGAGPIVGRALGLHMDVDMLTFTGSTAVGKLLMQYAGQSNLKIIKVECGGKSPQIILDHGGEDLTVACDAIGASLLRNQGQVCAFGSRLLVHRSAEKEVLNLLTERTAKAMIGDPLAATTTFGPVVSAKQRDKILGFIADANHAGAECIAGGGAVPGFDRGYFVQPTIFRGVRADSRLAQEEVFGPVLSVMTFENETDAVRIANSTIYGLAATVWTKNMSSGMRISRAIRSPVTINSAQPRGEGAGFAFSWEPAKQSGVGCEGGMPGLQSYFRSQTVRFNFD